MRIKNVKMIISMGSRIKNVCQPMSKPDQRKFEHYPTIQQKQLLLMNYSILQHDRKNFLLL